MPLPAGMAGAVGGGLLDLGVGAASSALSYRLDEKAAGRSEDWLEDERDLAYSRHKKLRSTQYQTAVKDLRKAGLNPILAAGRGIGGTSAYPGAPGAPSRTGQGSRAVGAGAQAITARSAASQRRELELTMQKQRDEIDARIGEIGARTRKISADAGISEWELRIRDALGGLSAGRALDVGRLGLSRFGPIANAARGVRANWRKYKAARQGKRMDIEGLAPQSAKEYRELRRSMGLPPLYEKGGSMHGRPYPYTSPDY